MDLPGSIPDSIKSDLEREPPGRTYEPHRKSVARGLLWRPSHLGPRCKFALVSTSSRARPSYRWFPAGPTLKGRTADKG